MAMLVDNIVKSLNNLHSKENKEWFSLREIYEEVEKVSGQTLQNGGASVRAALERHSIGSEVYKGPELFVMKEKGLGMYKSNTYDRINFIKKMVKGDSFTRDQLMAIFKISGQSGIMPSNTLNCIVITTAENNGFYDDSAIVNGMIQYTGAGTIGDQYLTGPNKSLANSKKDSKPVYLFSKDEKRRYTYEGEFELYDEPYQVEENGRKVYKFPFRLLDNNVEIFEAEEDLIEKISYEIVEISNELESHFPNSELVFKDGPLEIRKYRKDSLKHNTRTKKPDYIAEQIVKSKLGEENEKIVFEEELKRIFELEAKEQADKMEEFFKSKKENEGYDILSFELDENGNWVEKYIEVKSTKGSESTPIDITANELEFAKSHVDNYYLYRIINSESDNRYVKVVTGKELLKSFNFVPETYKIYSA